MARTAPRPRPAALVAALGGAAALLMAGLVALGVWQLQRLAWKEALVARIERQLAGAPGALPPVADWPRLRREADEYRRVQVQGRWDPQRQALVRASTVLGSGYWVLTPLQQADGSWVLVNRGFVPNALKAQVPPPAADGPLPGLLRLSEPGGSLLQANDPAADRWYGRDVAAIAAARGLRGPVAPYFVDLQAAPGTPPDTWPRPGLTVLQFPNHHLQYALTWFALAGLVGVAFGILLAHERRQRRLATVPVRADPDPTA